MYCSEKSFLHEKRLTVFARANRKKQTDSEKYLWMHIRGRQLKGYKFRRQFPVSHYILDFYCHEMKLAIEIDGSHHLKNKQYDLQRTKILNEYGIRVVRFWSNEVLTAIEGVLEKIILYLE